MATINLVKGQKINLKKEYALKIKIKAKQNWRNKDKQIKVRELFKPAKRYKKVKTATKSKVPEFSRQC